MAAKEVVSSPADVRAMLAALRTFATYRHFHARTLAKAREAKWPTPDLRMTAGEDLAHWIGYYTGLVDAYAAILRDLDHYEAGQ